MITLNFPAEEKKRTKNRLGEGNQCTTINVKIILPFGWWALKEKNNNA